MAENLNGALKKHIIVSLSPDDLAPGDHERLSALADGPLLLVDFVRKLQEALGLYCESPNGWSPLFLHFDEIGELDKSDVVAKHMPTGNATDLFYKFWSVLNDTIRLPNCFVYLSGKNSQLEVICHHHGNSIGLVERLCLEPLSVDHLMEMLGKPLPLSSPDGICMSQAVFGIDSRFLEDVESPEYLTLFELVTLVIHVTGGLPRAIDYSFGWFRDTLNSLDKVSKFLADTVMVLCSSSFI